MLRRQRFVFTVIIFICLALGSSYASASECKLTILHFNDLHGHLGTPEKGLGGAARLASLIGKIGAANEKSGRYTLLLNGGDVISGTPVSEKFEGQAEFDFLNAIGTEAMVIGNHDFDFGIEPLKKNMKAANFAILSANIIDKPAKRLFTTATYVFPLEKGCRVGIIGLTMDTTPILTGGDVSSLEFGNPIKYAGFYIDDLLEQSEVQVALTHLGVADDIKLAGSVPGLDVVVGGHNHVSAEEYCRVVKGIPVCQTPAYGKYLGRIDLKVENGRVVVEKTELIPIDRKAGKSKEVRKLLDGYLGEVAKSMDEIVGSLNRTLYYRPDDGTEPQSNLGIFVANAMKAASGVEAAFMNMQGLRGDLKKGKVTRGDIFEILPFQNYVGWLNITGEDIIKVIDHAEKIVQGGRSGPHLAWSGLEYGSRGGAYDVKINGKAMDRNARYKIATVDFIARGGSGYSMLKGKKFNSGGKLVRDVVAEYLKEGYVSF